MNIAIPTLQQSSLRRASIGLVAFALVAGGIHVLGRQEMGAVRALQCGLAAVLLAIFAWLAGGWLRNILVVLCSLVFGLTALEVMVLASLPAPGQPGPVEVDRVISGGRPLIGWGPTQPGTYRATKTEPDGHTIYDVDVTIDDNLNRKTNPSSGARPIVFFGDSWTFGAGLPDSATLPQAFADLTHGKIPVLNLGYLGWSPAVNLVALQTGLYRPLLDKPRHFVLFASMFHVERTACRAGYRFSSAPHYRLDGDRVKYAGPCSDIGGPILQPFINFGRRFALYDRIAPYFAQPTRQDVDVFMKIVEAFVAKAKQDYGVKTTVLVPPHGDVYIARSGYTEAQVVAKLRETGVDVLIDDLPKIPDEGLYWIEGDGHPTALSNLARARAIEAHIATVDPAALKVAPAPSP